MVPPKRFDIQRIEALLYKNSTLIIKKRFFLVLFFILPIVQICLVCVSFGKKLHDLPVTIFNGEQPPDLSQLFIDQIDNYLINSRESCDFDIAYNEVRQGKV